MAKPSVPLAMLLKSVIVVSSPTLLVLALFLVTGTIELPHFIYGYFGVMLISLFYVRSFLSNVSAMTHYVRALSEDRKMEAPDLGFLSAVGELSDALSILQRSWEKKKQQMESVITEREILVDTLPDILIMCDDDKRIVRTNRAARSIFGQNLSGKKLRDVVASDTLLSAVSGVIQDLRGREVEFRIDSPAPYDFLAVIERFPIPSAGGISIIIALNDITELKRVEQMRADFVANASHEIRTPLASIMGFIETLQGPAKDDPEARDTFLKIMADQGARMSRLISDLLSLSKIEMNAHTVPVGSVDVMKILRAEVQNIERAAQEKKMTIRLEMSDNLPAVNGEASEITQVLHNLIGNAVKYGNAETEVTVAAKVTSSLPPDPAIRTHGKAVMVSVRDRGEGIAKHHIPRLTERFYRVDSARTRTIGGTGLGLAIVKHILNRHQGAIVIDSTVGEGSVFTVYLPLYEAV